MKFKEWLIKKLEDDVEYTYGHINLEEVSEEERQKLFIQFGEGDENLTRFLKTAYKCGMPSIFCCCGHGVRSAYVVLKITDKNIKLAKKLGKILSRQKVITTFINDYKRGKIVEYRSYHDFSPEWLNFTFPISTDWLNLASQILDNPELFKDVEPDIDYYNEEKEETYPKPFGYDIKKKLLKFLRKRKTLPKKINLTENETNRNSKKTWELSEENKSKINNNHPKKNKKIAKHKDNGEKTL